MHPDIHANEIKLHYISYTARLKCRVSQTTVQPRCELQSGKHLLKSIKSWITLISNFGGSLSIIHI